MSYSLSMSVSCKCGWRGSLGECSHAIWLDPDPRKAKSVIYGGNGSNYRCPKCWTLLYYTRQ